jgi:N utilization substance protein A
VGACSHLKNNITVGASIARENYKGHHSLRKEFTYRKDDRKMSKEFFEAVKMLTEEKGIPEDYLYEKISSAIVVAAKHDYNGKDIVHCDIDPDKQKIKVYVTKNVVEEIEDEDTDLTLEQAQLIRKSAKVGTTINIPIKTKQLGRIVAQTAKHVIRQGIRDAEKGQLLQEFQSKNQELLTAKVERIDPVTGNITLSIGKNEAVLPKSEQVPGEVFSEGDTTKIFVVDVKDGTKGPKIMISRTHPGLVRRLFETEVPEIFDGTIEIKSVSREAGSRTKIAVLSKDEDIDPVGACIGPRGQRVSNIVEALGGEKIDIVKYNEDPAVFVAAALAPSDVVSVEILDEQAKFCRATVPDDQLSLAIGNKGQNVRLAAKLTSWKIDIKPESGFYEG